MAFKLADLFVQISGDQSPLNKTLAAAKGALLGFGAAGARGLASSLGPALGDVGKMATGALMGAGVAAAAGLGAGLYKAVNAASDLSETVSKVGVVFGDSKGVVLAGADEMAAKFGYPKQAFLDAAASIGLIGKAAGQSEGTAAQLGADFAKMAADASSFYNVPLEEALGAIRSGLVGESEPLRRFGVLLSEDAVKAEAARLGLAKFGAELTEGQKVQARSSLITKGLSDASGDLARTQSSAANRMREFWGRLENSAADVGEALMPAFGAILGEGINMVQGLGGLFERNKEAIAGWANSLAGNISAGIERLREFAGSVQEFLGGEGAANIQAGIGAAFTWLRDTVVEVLDVLGFALRNWDDLMEVVGLRAAERWTNLGELIGWFQGVVEGFLSWFGRNWKQVFVDTFNAAWAVASNTLGNIQNLIKAVWDYIANPGAGFNFDFKPLLDGFQASMEKLPEIAKPQLTSLQGQIDAVYGRIAEREVQRAKEANAKANAAAATPAADAGPAKKKKDEGPDPKKEKKLDISHGLGEFTKKIQEGVFGKGGAADRTAKATETLVDLSKQQTQIMTKSLSKPPGLAVAAGPGK